MDNVLEHENTFAVIGAGMSGVLAGIKLMESRIPISVIFKKPTGERWNLEI